MTMLRDRADAGRRLAQRLEDLPLRDPLVLGIPRGGVEVGAAIAEALGAELDVVLSRKLRSREQPELALGAISETGAVYLNPLARELAEAERERLDEERRHQAGEIRRRARLYRGDSAPAKVEGRSVIVADDGLATGSTMIAALHTLRAERPHETICAVPVGPPERLEGVRALCDRLVYLDAPPRFMAVGQFYEDFSEVSDDRVVELLRAAQRGRAR